MTAHAVHDQPTDEGVERLPAIRSKGVLILAALTTMSPAHNGGAHAGSAHPLNSRPVLEGAFRRARCGARTLYRLLALWLRVPLGGWRCSPPMAAIPAGGAAFAATATV